jgi:FAD/FMN-containing dehydrogenase
MLAGEFEGLVLQPGEDGYDEARTVWNAMVDRRPAVIARCANTADVVAAVQFGRANELEIGVRCGGHSVVGHPVPEGGLMIDLSPMSAVQVDPGGRRARVQGGALLGNLDREAQKHGLATTAGNVSHTGVGGLTLAGGMGWLARKFGLSCDNVVSFELVSADGAVLRVSENEHPDLYWGLRGGGGNFGVVTEFEFRLHPISGRALAVELFFALDAAEGPLHHGLGLIETAPREATITASAGTAGDWSFLPSEFRGRRIASIGYVWVGDPDDGRKFLPTLRGGASPLAEKIDEMTYLELQSVDDDTREQHGQRRYWKGHYFRELSHEAIRALVAPGVGDPATDDDAAYMPAAGMQSYGGAIADLTDDATAFSHRGALAELVIRARWTDPSEDAKRMGVARRYAKSLEPFASGAYVNTAMDGGQVGSQRVYSEEKLARLTALKDQYDPDNVFSRNANIQPSNAAGT